MHSERFTLYRIRSIFRNRHTRITEANPRPTSWEEGDNKKEVARQTIIFTLDLGHSHKPTKSRYQYCQLDMTSLHYTVRPTIRSRFENGAE